METILIRKAVEADIKDITEIYNHAVINTDATFDTEVKTERERLEWLHDHDDKYCVLVAQVGSRVVGYASLSHWSTKRAYDHTVELSVYIHIDYRRQGIGKKLMQEAIKKASENGIHLIMSLITDGNEASIILHKLLGFKFMGTQIKPGFKFGKLIDVHYYQLYIE